MVVPYGFAPQLLFLRPKCFEMGLEEGKRGFRCLAHRRNSVLLYRRAWLHLPKRSEVSMTGVCGFLLYFLASCAWAYVHAADSRKSLGKASHPTTAAPAVRHGARPPVPVHDTNCHDTATRLEKKTLQGSFGCLPASTGYPVPQAPSHGSFLSLVRLASRMVCHSLPRGG